MLRVGRIGRILIVALAIGGVAVVVTLSRGGGEPACKEPVTSAIPAWFPRDIPLPADTQTIQVLEAPEGLRRIALDVRRSLDDTVAFILDRFPGAGWELGVGEREAWEAENTFVKSRRRYGQFRALLTCDTMRTQLVLTMTDVSR